jgi:phage gpG-like protein
VTAAIEADGTKQVSANLKDFGDRATDAKPAMQKVRSIMEGGIARNFETSGSYLGESWAPLAPGTLARKARLGQGSRILVATDTMGESLTGGRGKRGSATKTMARSGTGVWYSIFAQAGTSGAGHGASAPKRRVVGMTQRDATKSIRIIEKFVMTGEVF